MCMTSSRGILYRSNFIQYSYASAVADAVGIKSSRGRESTKTAASCDLFIVI